MPVDAVIRLACSREEACELREDLRATQSAVLERGIFRDGPERQALENELAAFLHARAVVAVSSGSAALAVALKALRVGRGDEVIVAGNVDISVAAPISNAGAAPIWCDVSERTLNLDPAAMSRLVTPSTRAIVMLHMYGNPASSTAIRAVADQHGLVVIEDFSHAVGSEMDGRRCGTLAPVAVASLSHGKPLAATGTAGVVVVDDARLEVDVRVAANYGLEPSALAAINAGRVAHFRCRTDGFNATLDELQSAALRVKLGRLEQWITQRRQLADAYASAFTGCRAVRPQAAEIGARPVLRHFALTTTPRSRVLAALAARGIEAGGGYRPPLYRQPLYSRMASSARVLRITEKLARRLVCLPLHPYLSTSDVEEVATIVRSSAEGAARRKARHPSRQVVPKP